MTRALAGTQEGSRWINVAPTGDQVAAWFAENVKLHDGLEHKHYVQGITLIPQKDKPRIVEDGKVVDDLERLVYIPYAKVETRIAYFWDWVATLGETTNVSAAIVPAEIRRIRGEGLTNENLPDGFFRFPVKDAAGKDVPYLGCSMQVQVRERTIRSGDAGRMVLGPPAGTKVVPMLDRYGPDDNAFMKAETGAVGRALGMAGMLVIPGSGVATAEDMLENAGGRGAGSSGDVPAAIPGGGVEGDPREHVVAMLDELQADFPEAHQAVQEWAKERKLTLSDITDSALRGVVRFLEKTLAEAKEAQQGPPKAEIIPTPEAKA